MRDKVIFGFSILWIIALSVTLTIFLAIPLFFGEIFWYQLTDLVQMTAGKIWHNFLILMNYLINPLETKLSMPDFPSSPFRRSEKFVYACFLSDNHFDSFQYSIYKRKSFDCFP